MLLMALALTACSSKQKPLKITGSTTVNLPVAEAAETLRTKYNLKIFVDTQGGSSGGITAIGEGTADIGMASKSLIKKDHDRFPDVKLITTSIGSDAVALVVAPDVYNGGVKSLTKKQVQDIYEKKVTNWNQLGGSDQPIVFYNKEPGRGTWEVFAKYLYGKAKYAPEVSHPEVGANEEARTKVSTTPGAITQLSVAWADNKTTFALNLINEQGTPIAPTIENIAEQTYPMNRPLNLITQGQPTGDIKTIIDYLLSPEGQTLVEKHGYLPLFDAK